MFTESFINAKLEKPGHRHKKPLSRIFSPSACRQSRLHHACVPTENLISIKTHPQKDMEMKSAYQLSVSLAKHLSLPFLIF